jgi:hypothetical protein
VFKLIVEMFGLPQKISQEGKVEIQLRDNASLKEVVTALKRKIPDLEGPVIRQGQDELVENYAFIVNGQFQAGDSNLRIRPDDRTVLVLLATGG